MKIIKTTSGYTVIYSMIFFMIVLILGVGAITVAQVANQTQMKKVSIKQAYLNARSISKIFTEKVEDSITEVIFDRDASLTQEENKVIQYPPILSVKPYRDTLNPQEEKSELDDLITKMILYRSSHLDETVSFSITIKELNSKIQCTFLNNSGKEYDFVAEIIGVDQTNEYSIFAEYTVNTKPDLHSARSDVRFYYELVEYRSESKWEGDMP